MVQSKNNYVSELIETYFVCTSPQACRRQGRVRVPPRLRANRSASSRPRPRCTRAPPRSSRLACAHPDLESCTQHWHVNSHGAAEAIAYTSGEVRDTWYKIRNSVEWVGNLGSARCCWPLTLVPVIRLLIIAILNFFGWIYGRTKNEDVYKNYYQQVTWADMSIL